MTQRDLAALLGISQQAVGRYESGTRTPRARMISLIETITEGVVSLRHFTEDASGIDDPRSDPAAI